MRVGPKIFAPGNGISPFVGQVQSEIQCNPAAIAFVSTLSAGPTRFATIIMFFSARSSRPPGGTVESLPAQRLEQFQEFT